MRSDFHTPLILSCFGSLCRMTLGAATSYGVCSRHVRANARGVGLLTGGESVSRKEDGEKVL